MKRDPALVSLSHDHHKALFLAHRLRKAEDAGVDELRDEFLAYWQGHGEEHFRIEEALLFPGYAEFGDARHPLVVRALTDHVEIRRDAQKIVAGQPTREQLAAIGTALGEHVRMEERELFPMIEATLPSGELAALGAQIDAAEAASAGRIHDK